MKKYENPNIEIKKFESENILTMSGTAQNRRPIIDGGSTNFKNEWLKQ